MGHQDNNVTEYIALKEALGFALRDSVSSSISNLGQEHTLRIQIQSGL
jgi:hypothetical protein